MSLFKKSRLQSEHNLDEARKKVEIVAHREATKEQIDKVKKANEALNDLFEQNHFSLTIYLAAGGEPEQMKTKIGDETSKTWERKD